MKDVRRAAGVNLCPMVLTAIQIPYHKVGFL